MKNPISERLREHADELLKIADAIDALYFEASSSKHAASRLAEIANRGDLLYAERQIVEAALMAEKH